MQTKRDAVFQTDRTRRFRAQKLSPDDAITIEHVEQFGCSVLYVKGNAACPAFSYTIGVFDTAGKPEIITIGLQEPVARALLNAAANRLRAGVDLTDGRQAELLGDVECEFRPVDSKWVSHLMHLDQWYYDREDFPVLQAVYPDLQNRFPEEEGFEARFAQPLLQPGARMTEVEDDFWAANDSGSSLYDWKFADDPHTCVYLSETVHKGTEMVTYVSHDEEDGSWQFLGDSMSDGGGPVISCLHHPLDKDPSLRELADLPLGCWAEREEPGKPWARSKRRRRSGSR